MGADFVYATCPRFQHTGDRVGQLQRMVNELSTAALEEIAESQGCDLDKVVGSLFAAIDELPRIDSRRDISTIARETGIHWITGGMSWGDPPTAAYTTFAWLLATESIASQIETWAAEDGPSF